jgi:hypothetical protein
MTGDGGSESRADGFAVPAPCQYFVERDLLVVIDNQQLRAGATDRPEQGEGSRASAQNQSDVSPWIG